MESDAMSVRKSTITNEVIEIISEKFFRDLGDILLDGVNYVLAFDTEESKVNEYKALRNKIEEHGVNPQSVMKILQVCNGYIFELNSSVAKRVLINELNKASKEFSMNSLSGSIVENSPKERKQVEYQRFAKRCIKEMTAGVKEFEVALYGKNSSGIVRYSAKVDKKDTIFNFVSYALTPIDMERINEELLVNRGIKISRISHCEILPPKTGVRMKIQIMGI